MFMTNQQKEIETIRPKNIILNLSEADCGRLSDLCGTLGITIAELLEGFVGDLVDGTYSHGSDERACAREYVERCGYDFQQQKSFLHWLLNVKYYNVEDFVESLENLDDFKKELELYEKDPSSYDEEEIECMRGDMEQVEQELAELRGQFKKYSPEADWEQEVAHLQAWWKERERFIKE